METSRCPLDAVCDHSSQDMIWADDRFWSGNPRLLVSGRADLPELHLATPGVMSHWHHSRGPSINSPRRVVLCFTKASVLLTSTAGNDDDLGPEKEVHEGGSLPGIRQHSERLINKHENPNLMAFKK